MASADEGLALRQMTRLLRRAAKLYLRIKKPQLVMIAGSVGKTSTKSMLGTLLAEEKRVSFMDESYNYGLGLYLSIFEQKVPTRLNSPTAWLATWARIAPKFLARRPEIMVLEYGISHPDHMDKFLKFALPDVAILTAVTPEHMEFLKDIETVAREETKILDAAREFAVVNEDDIEERFIPKLANLEFYGSGPRSRYTYKIKSIDSEGATVDIQLSEHRLPDLRLNFISEHLIRQVCGAAAVAWRLGVSLAAIKRVLPTLQPTPGRMRLLKGAHDSALIDDSANFSPVAGVRALETLKQLEAKRHIVVFGNMHELGAYEEEGFRTVAAELDDIDLLLLVGPLARKYFGKFAPARGFKRDDNMFFFDDAISAGRFLRHKLHADDVVLIKGPFGGYYLEECTKQLLAHPNDAQYLPRQSPFWQHKKQQLFGDLY